MTMSAPPPPKGLVFSPFSEGQERALAGRKWGKNAVPLSVLGRLKWAPWATSPATGLLTTTSDRPLSLQR